jgi:hypothetical protein
MSREETLKAVLLPSRARARRDREFARQTDPPAPPVRRADRPAPAERWTFVRADFDKWAELIRRASIELN